MQPAEIAVGQELGFFWTLTALWQEPDLLHVRLHLPAIERESLETCNLPCNLMSVLVGSSRTGPVRMLVIAPTDTERVHVRTVTSQARTLSLHHHDTPGGRVTLAVGLADPSDPPVTVHAVTTLETEHVQDVTGLSPRRMPDPHRPWLPWRRDGLFRLDRG